MTEKKDFAGHQPRIDVVIEVEGDPEELPTMSGYRHMSEQWPSPSKADEERRMRHRVTWRQLIDVEMQVNADSWDAMEYIAMKDSDSLDTEFDNDYGSTDGCPFTAWTKDYVYFPIQYDGAEWVGSAPRHPEDRPLRHQGGG